MRVFPGSGSIPPEGEQPSASADLPKRFAFHGRRKTLAWMVFKYGIFTLLTLGIYRFWAKTHLRRYLWGATEFDGDRFEWHGTVKELFIGFLIALAVLLPLAIVDGILRTALVASPTALGFYSLLYLFIVLFLINFAFYRMWRYRMTRTSWRSIRFNMTGSAVNYALHAICWTLLMGITLGLAYPWMQAALIRKRLNETEIGGTQVSCTLRGGQLFPRFLLCYFLGFLALIIPTTLTGLLFGASAEAMMDDPITSLFLNFAAGAAGLLAAVPFILAALLYYRVFAYRKMAETTNVGSVTLSASLPVRPLVWSALLTGAAIALVLVLPFGGSILLAMTMEAFGGGSEVALAGISVAITLSMFATILVMPLISAISMAGFVFTSLKAFLEGTMVENPAELDDLVQNAGPMPKRGEGFADALDVGAF